MSLPPNTGGRKILDITSWNNAIKIMKLKKILDYSELRPTASDAAIAIIIGSLPKLLQNKNINDNSILNIFLQTAYNRQCYTNKNLPNSIHEILNAGAKYHLALVGIIP